MTVGASPAMLGCEQQKTGMAQHAPSRFISN
jgi:hypothetical protein